MEQSKLCSYEQSLALKHAGFDRETTHMYSDRWDAMPQNPTSEDYILELNGWQPENINLHYAEYGCISAPNVNDADDWLREVKGIHIVVMPAIGWTMWFLTLYDKANMTYQNRVLDDEQRKSHTAALSAGITEGLKLLNPQP